jgi:hypothetical protein
VTATKAADTNYKSNTSVAATVAAKQAIAIVNSLPTASAITYGQMLSSSTFTGGSATPSAGSFQWTSPTTVPLAGIQSESVIYVPTDTVDYSSSAPSTVNVTVRPASYIVTVSSDDSGTASKCTPQTTPGHGTDASCSLRDALLEAAATGGGNITFDATAFATAKTITLANGVLSLPSATTIAGATTGSGATLANLVAVDGNGASTVFSISSGVTGASIANLIIQHGNSAGIRNAGALTLTGDSITSNSNSGAGGGGIINSGGLTLTASTISGNTSGAAGGGIANTGTLTLSDDTITGNSASNSGGGIDNLATLVVSDSTLSANTAATASGGGGIDNVGSGTVALANSVLSGNTSNSVSDDFDGVAYSNSGGNIVGVANGATVKGTAVDLAPLASYGGPTQTLVPLPGSPAICAGLASAIPSGLTTDQRGLPNTNASYPSYPACVDAGAVQTNYALSFTTQPTGASVATNFAAGVTLTESGNPFQPSVTIPLALTGSGTLTGGSTTTLAGVASYTLQVNMAGSSDHLTATLALDSALSPAVAISATSNTFGVGITTPTVGLALSSSSISYGSLETFTATVPSAATGTVNFYNNGSTLLGSGTVSGGTATFSSSTLAVGSYSVTAAYSGDSNYSPNTSSAQSLTINPVPAAITGPTNGGTLTGASTTFTWSAGAGGVTGYYFHVGTTAGGADLVNIGPLSGTSTTVTLPTNGTTIYVQLQTNFSGGAIVLSSINTYTEFTQSAAAITSPTNGSTLTGASTTFTWSAGTGGVTGYYLHIGTTSGAANLVNIGPLSGTGATVTLPTNGTTIYVQLETHIGNTILENNNTYAEFTQSAAAITSPTNGSTLTGASTTFTWSAGAGGVTGYYLHVGTTPGGVDLVNIGPLSGTSATVTLPTNGTTIYVQLETHIGNTILENNNTYTEFTQSAAAITSPTNGSMLTGASTTFTWSAGTGGVTGYYLHVGTTPGGVDLVNIGPLSGTSVTVNLPTNGTTIYVQLETHIGNTILENNNTYTEYAPPAVITSPTNGSTLTGASTTFTWSAGTGGVTGYYLHVGTTPGGVDLVNIGPLSGTSATVTLPTSGATIYAQLQTNFSGGAIELSSINTYTEFTP